MTGPRLFMWQTVDCSFGLRRQIQQCWRQRLAPIVCQFAFKGVDFRGKVDIGSAIAAL